jgi:hypothetical protein
MVYTWFNSLESCTGVCDHVCRFYGYDPQKCLLILEFLDETIDLKFHTPPRDHLPLKYSTALGEALAVFHRLDLSSYHQHGSERLQQAVPWVFYIHHPEIEFLGGVSSGNLQLIAIIQQFKELCDTLDKLRRAWVPTSLVHFDLRWDNCVLRAKPKGSRSQIVIVDWETAGKGDPCWDVGTVLSDLIHWWVLSIPLTVIPTMKSLRGPAKSVLENTQKSASAFWRSYSRLMGIDKVHHEELLTRAVQYSAARLIQTAYEGLQKSATLTQSAVYLLQLSSNMLTRPDEALSALFGMSNSSWLLSRKQIM